MLRSVRPSVPCRQLTNGAFYGYGYYRTLTRHPLPEVKPADQRGRTAAGNSRKGRGISFHSYRGDTLLSAVMWSVIISLGGG